jgi:hypothetical protein
MPKIIFIVGVGRSGTTLLQNMLNSHPDIAFIPEINYTRRFLFNEKLLNIYRQDKNEFLIYLKNDKWIKRLDDKILEAINLEKIQESDFAYDLYKEILNINCKINKKSIAGDKDPRSVELVKKISGIIPDIYWINIVRDPRDVLLSKKATDWSKNSKVLKHIFAGRVQLYLAETWRNKYPNSFYELYYEDLISNPEEELIKICRLLNLDYDSKMLDFTDSADKLVAEDELAWKKGVFSPVNKDNQSKWKEDLDVNSIAMVESLITPAFKLYSYKKSKPSINFYWKIKLVLLKPIFCLFTTLYIWYKRI